jgi:hypothetical protein
VLASPEPPKMSTEDLAGQEIGFEGCENPDVLLLGGEAELAEYVSQPKIGRAPMQRHLRRVVSDGARSTYRNGVNLAVPPVVDPLPY